jgi:putative spermidine/putrescine transport system substrate-binding protein
MGALSHGPATSRSIPATTIPPSVPSGHGLRAATLAAAALAVSGLMLAAGCSSSSNSGSSGSSSGSGKAVDAATATSAAAFGGMNGLVAACKTEGTLNVITLPANWAN